MFGTFRLVLALMVVWDHMSETGFAGRMAVFGFFCLSGYLMTKIIKGPYADGMLGFMRYVANRALRIYPAYFAMLAVVVPAVLLLPGAISGFEPGLFEPQNLLPSITIVGLRPFQPTFSPPAWSLHVELLHYIAIGALLGRSRIATLIWFVFALDMRVLGPYLLADLALEGFYFTALGSTLPFATGAMLWHFRDSIPKSNETIAFIAGTVFVAVGVMMTVEAGFAYGLNIAIVVAAIAIAALRSLEPSELDTLLGDLAYPIFLFHAPCFRIARGVFGHEGFAPTATAVALTIALSWFTLVLIDRPLRRTRASLRLRSNPNGDIQPASEKLP